jgi:hypothetical protein
VAFTLPAKSTGPKSVLPAGRRKRSPASAARQGSLHGAGSYSEAFGRRFFREWFGGLWCLENYQTMKGFAASAPRRPIFREKEGEVTAEAPRAEHSAVGRQRSPLVAECCWLNGHENRVGQ